MADGMTLPQMAFARATDALPRDERVRLANEAIEWVRALKDQPGRILDPTLGRDHIEALQDNLTQNDIPHGWEHYAELVFHLQRAPDLAMVLDPAKVQTALQKLFYDSKTSTRLMLGAVAQPHLRGVVDDGALLARAEHFLTGERPALGSFGFLYLAVQDRPDLRGKIDAIVQAHGLSIGISAPADKCWGTNPDWPLVVAGGAQRNISSYGCAAGLDEGAMFAHFQQTIPARGGYDFRPRLEQVVEAVRGQVTGIAVIASTEWEGSVPHDPQLAKNAGLIFAR